jgi:hypothetical protein
MFVSRDSARHLGGKDVDVLQGRWIGEQVRRLLHQRRPDAAGEVRLATTVIGEHVEDAVGGLVEPDGDLIMCRTSDRDDRARSGRHRGLEHDRGPAVVASPVGDHCLRGASSVAVRWASPLR